MRKLVYALTVLACFLLPNAALGSDKYVLPKITVAGADEAVETGDMAVLKINLSEVPPQLKDVTYRWLVLDGGKPKRVIPWPDGSQIAFGVGKTPRRFTVIVDIDCYYEVGDGKGAIIEAGIESPDLIVFEIQSTDDGKPTPTPNPDPPTPTPNPDPPKPVPSFPDGKYKLSTFGFSLINDAVLTADEKKRLAMALAKTYGSVAARIEALSTYRNVSQILTDTASDNARALAETGIPLAKLEPYKKKLGDKIYDLYKTQRTMSTATDISTAWKELVVGFVALSE